MGTFVNTLSLNLSWTDLSWQELSLPDRAAEPRLPPRACPLGAGMIICSGMVRGVADPTGLPNAYLAQLPEGMRPASALPFIGLGRQVSGKKDRNAPEPQLTMLVVMPDGWIVSSSIHAPHSYVDLSAVRFSLGRGVGICDEVRLHTCDLAGSRVVMLQGSLAERSFPQQCHTPFCQLPPACRPASEVVFVVSGVRAGSQHLITIKPTKCQSKHLGADVIWSDAFLDHDVIHLTGVMYEVASDALEHTLGGPDWSANRKKLVVFEFQRILLRKYGSLTKAWHEAFDIEYVGHINFTKFTRGCKAAGYNGNLFRLWRMFDEDGSGEITLDELGIEVGKLDCTLPVVQSPDERRALVDAATVSSAR